MKTINDPKILLLILVCFTMFFINLDAFFINIMEARNFITAREMLNDGNWIFTTLNGVPRYQKPPLPTWIIAFFGAIFGLKNLLVLRLPAALMGLLLVLSFYKFSNKIFKKQSFSFIAALILATSFYIVVGARDANWDIFTHAFMMVSIYFLYVFFSKKENTYHNALLAALFFAGSFMSKGPVSIYALLLPFLIAYHVVYKIKILKDQKVALLLFLVVAAIGSGWWYLYTYTHDTAAVIKITERETSNWVNYNVRPFYYYWNFVIQSGIWSLIAFIGLFYPYLKDKVWNKKGYLFTITWTLASVILLSIIPEKKPRYLLPVLIPLALNTAFYIEYLFRKFYTLTNKWETIPVYLSFGVVAIIGFVLPIGGYLLLNNHLSGQWIRFVLFSITLFAIGVSIFKFLFQKKIKQVFYLMIAFIPAIICFGMPLVKTLAVNPEYRGMAVLNNWSSNTNTEIYEYSRMTPELIWDYGKPIKVLTTSEGITIPSENKFAVLATKQHSEILKTTFEEMGFSVKKIDYSDINPKTKGIRPFRQRLYRNLFLITKE